MRLTPKEIEKHLQKIHEQYEKKLHEFGALVMKEKIIPILEREQKSFVMMNGFPACYLKDGTPTPLPSALRNLMDTYDAEGWPFRIYLTDHNPFDQDFSALEEEKFQKRLKGMTTEKAALQFMMAFN